MARQALTKRVFLQQYVLSRAQTVVETLEPLDSFKDAIKVWEKIEKELQ